MAKERSSRTFLQELEKVLVAFAECARKVPAHNVDAMQEGFLGDGGYLGGAKQLLQVAKTGIYSGELGHRMGSLLLPALQTVNDSKSCHVLKRSFSKG